MSLPVDAAFTKALPKTELHAHLSGSISRETLHDIWKDRQRDGKCMDLEDPLIAIKPASDGFIDIASFFPLFDKYIYALCNDVETVKRATNSVLADFEADGVRHLELRTTPRGCPETGMTQKSYIEAIHDVVNEWNMDQRPMEVYMILSVDRRMSASEAMAVVDLALSIQFMKVPQGEIVGVDLCGDPRKGDVSTFTAAFEKAKERGLAVTAHFAETLQSSTDSELDTILSWQPDRLGHCIYVSPRVQAILKQRKMPLELCLSCNVLAGLTEGGYGQHHVKQWLASECPVALSTDDVGIFSSPLSNEYLLVAQHYQLDSSQLIALAREAAGAAIAGEKRMYRLIDQFARQCAS